MRLSRILGRAESDPGRRAQLMRPGYLRGLVTGYGLSLVLACGASAVTSSSAREFQGFQVPPALAAQVDAARLAILARWPACTLDGWTLPLGLPALWAFACGRGAQEKTFAELNGEFALDVVPTKHYAANSAWQQLSILAHNLIRSFQLETLAEPKPRSRKRTYAYLFRSMRTLRFLLIARAGRVTRLGGRNVLRLTRNPATEILYAQIAHRLAA